jgi:hypothetical protein
MGWPLWQQPGCRQAERQMFVADVSLMTAQSADSRFTNKGLDAARVPVSVHNTRDCDGRVLPDVLLKQ